VLEQIEIEQFLRTFFATTTGAVFVCSLPNEKGKGGEQSVVTRDTATIMRFLSRWDVAGRGTYYCTGTLKSAEDRIPRRRMYESPRRTENIAELVGLHADIDYKNVTNDPDDILRQLKQLPCAPTIIVRSGHGWQCFWLFREAIGTDLGADIIARIVAARAKLAELLAGDAVQDLPRLMRLPGSRNTKGGDSIMVTVKELNACRRYDLQELEAWIAEQRPLFERAGAAGNPVNGGSVRLPPEQWLEIVTGGANDGNRNVQTARLTGHLLRNSSLDPRVIHALIQCWNIAAVKPPLDTKEITTIVNSIAGRELRRMEND
jgi:hypothetical protein